MEDEVWSSQAEPYIRKMALMHGWKFESIGLDSDDYTQEAYFAYQRCLKQYGTILNEKEKLTGEFKRAITNMTINLAKKASAEKECRDHSNLSDKSEPAASVVYEEMRYLQDLVRQAPWDIKEALLLILKSPTEIISLAEGLSPKRRKEVKAYLSNGSSRGVVSNRTLGTLLKFNRFRYDLLDRTKKYVLGQPLGGKSCILDLRGKIEHIKGKKITREEVLDKANFELLISGRKI